MKTLAKVIMVVFVIGFAFNAFAQQPVPTLEELQEQRQGLVDQAEGLQNQLLDIQRAIIQLDGAIQILALQRDAATTEGADAEEAPTE